MLLITFEGIEGCGKTTQARILFDAIRTTGKDVLLTREPGGTRIGDALREILLDPENISMSPRTELLLYEAARAHHVEEIIRPALLGGTIVLCDRFVDSTTAYQGFGLKLDAQCVRSVNELATNGLMPDLTFLIDIEPEEGMRRKFSSSSPDSTGDRIERRDLSFHQRVRNGFLAIAGNEPQRVVVIDGHRPVDEISRDVMRHQVIASLLNAGAGS